MAQEQHRHEASGQMRSREEIMREIAEREMTNQRLGREMRDLPDESLMWKAKKNSIDKNVSIIAVLRWVLGEDLLWE